MQIKDKLRHSTMNLFLGAALLVLPAAANAQTYSQEFETNGDVTQNLNTNNEFDVNGGQGGQGGNGYGGEGGEAEATSNSSASNGGNSQTNKVRSGVLTSSSATVHPNDSCASQSSTSVGGMVLGTGAYFSRASQDGDEFVLVKETVNEETGEVTKAVYSMEEVEKMTPEERTAIIGDDPRAHCRLNEAAQMRSQRDHEKEVVVLDGTLRNVGKVIEGNNEINKQFMIHACGNGVKTQFTGKGLEQKVIPITRPNMQHEHRSSSEDTCFGKAQQASKDNKDTMSDAKRLVEQLIGFEPAAGQ